MASSDYSDQPPLTGAPSGEPSVQPSTEPAGGSHGAASADAPAPVQAAPEPAAVVQFSDLGLAPEILRALDELGYKAPTPIQTQAIPHVLRGIDLLGGAQTGTGKTAAFALPMLQRLRVHANNSVSPARHQVRALILAPTRELAAQVEESVRAYAKYTMLRATCVFGGVSIDPQIAQLRSGVEIVVATPGRLLDHIQQKTISLSQVEYLVLDEADRMLDMGFMPDIKRILALLPERRQSLLFSATFPEEVKRLSEQLLKSPIRIEVARPTATAETITHIIHRCDEGNKRRLLSHLVRSRELTQVLVFTRTKQTARRLTVSLQQEGLSTAEIHSDKTQAERMQALADFKANRITLLVATDIAARGLDIDHLPHVINYELPQSAEDYVHRIGRTGRAGMLGEAISLVSPGEDEMLASIEKLIKRKLPVCEVEGWTPSARPGPGLGAGSHERERPARDGDRGASRSGPSRDRGADRPRPGRDAVRDSTRDPARERGRGPDRPSDRTSGSSARRRMPDDPLFTTAYVPPPLPAAPAHGTAAPGTESAAVVRRRRSPVPALLSAPPESA
jgi:ATP-dependent RNA helicase RhlE